MPRGFGKARLELTVTETLRERLAAKTGTDQNIEVTKTASNILETVAEVGSYWSTEDKRQVNILNRQIVQTGVEVDRLAELHKNWHKVHEKQFTQALDSFYKLLHASNEGFTIFENVISRLFAVIGRYESSLEKCLSACKIYKDTIDYLKDELVKAKIENIRLKAVQAEHCIGCPASYL